MEQFLIAIAIALGLAAVAVAVVARFWKQILKWAEDSLFPWIKTNIPWIESEVRQVFSAVDNVAVATRNIFRKAWEKLREYLLKLVIKLERKSSGEWKKRVTSWKIKIESGQKVPVRTETEEVVDWEDLPQDVREEWLKQEKSKVEIDVTEYRDREIMEMYT
ncbi:MULTISPECIES: hypothetical protein [Okeania]|uniref:Uncharacterized protein n=1 Tax=Okeania hirsuta TaxID=1458930 RepID=A0A3N6PQ66_9CYAN|nr:MULTISPECIES: hypothetical protein [Okeania]NET15577.1 hypothetical protein [Okeania sp. SIO1H6]NES78499.1 hypothetical protein [Okeania sp. SIO1H4]NES92807.1 hypothetical protein [Okeania sp. SIO2B9]NET22029.1 hypothetical protein [Okeania sp. SIO1H5]NET78508.1 hypothetical protein [Okeania sp. SIO1F9]